jgi:hypothetical protein
VIAATVPASPLPTTTTTALDAPVERGVRWPISELKIDGVSRTAMAPTRASPAARPPRIQDFELMAVLLRCHGTLQRC